MKGFLSLTFLLLCLITSAQKKTDSVIALKPGDTKIRFEKPVQSIPVNNIKNWDETEAFKNGFSRVLLHDKFSFVNEKGALIAPVEFEGARDFSNGLAAVKSNGKWGFISENGTVIFDFKYDLVFDFKDTVTVAMENKKWYLLNHLGPVIKALDIDVCYGFENGKAKIVKADR